MAKVEKEEYRTALANCQRLIKAANLPVVVMVEGWDSAGKGSMLGSIINYMDPRFFKFYNMDEITDEDRQHSFLHRYFVKLPAAGQFTFYDGGYVDQVIRMYLHNDIDKEKLIELITSIYNYERQLADNGYLVVKFFIDLDKDTQKKRFDKMLEDPDTAWQVTEEDKFQNKHYEEFAEWFEKILKATDTVPCPWHRLDTRDRDEMEAYIANTIVDAIHQIIENPRVAPISDKRYPMSPVENLADVSLADKVYAEEAYKEDLKKLQKELGELQLKVYRKKIPVIIAYEGWDAAGKGGNIKRLVSALDPRSYEVYPIASPNWDEKNRHYLWRFYNRMPREGRIAIFDRTWYGRVLVERLEGFCSENDWKRAYNEINEFELDLVNWGAVVVKFWVQIDKDTQLERFNDRQNTPDKQWKITEEDWRNREKWDMYEEATNEMLAATSTAYAPWVILESNDKKYARIKALKTIIEAIRKKLKEV